MLVSELIEMLEAVDPDLDIDIAVVDPADGTTLTLESCDFDIEESDDEGTVILRASIDEAEEV